MTDKETGIICIILILISTMGILGLGCVNSVFLVKDLNPKTIFDSNIIIDKTITPTYYNNLKLPPDTNVMYCIYAETISRGEPVKIEFHYIAQVTTTPDRFGSTTNKQEEQIFITGNNNIVNTTIIVPHGATNPIITISYYNRTDTNKVHLIITKC